MYTQKESGFDVSIKEEIITVPMTEIQRSLIEKLRMDRVAKNPSGDVILADTNVKLQSKVHQICSGSVKNEAGAVHLLSCMKAGAIKTRFEGKKIAIYYKFKGELTQLTNTFPNWTADPEIFQQNSDVVFLGQFISSREGIRLDAADAIIFFNIDFSFLSYEQAKNRIISKERTKEAILYWVFTSGGIEEKIYKVVKNKQDYTNYFFKKDYGIKGTGKKN